MTKYARLLGAVLAIATIVSCVSCGKKKETNPDSGYIFSKFEVDTLTVRIPKEEKKEDNREINNGTAVKDKNTNEIISYGSTGGEAKLAEVDLQGNDNTEYYLVNGNDIVYDGVRYMNLKRYVSEIEQPYTETTFINFIVKTYGPISDSVYVSLLNQKDPSTTEGMSMSLSDDLAMNWSEYKTLKNKYNSEVQWKIDLCDMETFGRNACLMGNKDYVIYQGANGVVQVDMTKLSTIKPNIVNIPSSAYKYPSWMKDETSETTENNDGATGENGETPPKSLDDVLNVDMSHEVDIHSIDYSNPENGGIIG